MPFPHNGEATDIYHYDYHRNRLKYLELRRTDWCSHVTKTLATTPATALLLVVNPYLSGQNTPYCVFSFSCHSLVLNFVGILKANLFINGHSISTTVRVLAYV